MSENLLFEENEEKVFRESIKRAKTKNEEKIFKVKKYFLRMIGGSLKFENERTENKNRLRCGRGLCQLAITRSEVWNERMR